jgi:hypothetical protein
MDFDVVSFNMRGGGRAGMKDPLLVILGVISILYGAMRLEHGEAYSQTVEATITQVSSTDSYANAIESLLHVTFSVDGEEYKKTIRTSGSVYFVDEVVNLVYVAGSPEGAMLAPPMSASLDAWCCIGLGVLLLVM